jgi:hypothetical protein
MDLLFLETKTNTDLTKVLLETIQSQKKNVEISQKIQNTMNLIFKLSIATKTSYVQASLKKRS